MEHKIGIDKITEFTNHAVKSELCDREEHFAVGKVVLRFLTICSLNIFSKFRSTSRYANCIMQREYNLDFITDSENP